jgi:hypothetical protein
MVCLEGVTSVDDSRYKRQSCVLRGKLGKIKNAHSDTKTVQTPERQRKNTSCHHHKRPEEHKSHRHWPSHADQSWVHCIIRTQTFNQVQPAPPANTVETFHAAHDSGGKDTTERPGDDGGRIEYREPLGEFLSLVPSGQ